MPTQQGYPMVGKMLGHYRVLEQIGAGGRGIVYRAHDERLDRDVALKVLRPGMLNDQSARIRFRKEAQALSKLNHPNIATVYDFDQEKGVEFLVLEYIPGVTLDEKLTAGGLPPTEAARLGIQMAVGLAAAHEQEIIHRDLKPGNLRLTLDGRLKILDFGLAKLLRPVAEIETAAISTASDVVAGTVPYMAPEQLLGQPVDARTDIYAAGVVLYEMATGRRPFPWVHGPRLVDAILHETPKPPSALNRHVSAALENVILKAMDPEPRRRYQSAKELLVDLERLTTLVSAPEIAPGHRPRSRGWSLAVLPFVNGTNDPDAEYLSDGITESLINGLSQLPKLRVMARTTVFRFKGQHMDPRDIGHELGVRAVLTGRVIQRSSAVNIQAELVNVADGSQLWGERYNRPMSDLIAVQEQISDEITRRLRLRLTRDERKPLTKRYTQDVEAYQFYLKGRYYSDKWTAEGMKRAITYYRQAIEKDPNYAVAYAGLAGAYFGVSSQFLSPNDAMPKVREAASRALETDETLAEPHTLLGIVKAFYEHDFPGAEREFTRALECHFGSAAAHQWYAYYLSALGRKEQALTEAMSAEELDPLSGTVNLTLGLCFVMAREYENAIQQLRKTIEVDPNSWLAHLWLGWAYEQTGRHEEALANLTNASQLGGSTYAIAYLGYLHASAGRRSEAEKIVNELKQQSQQKYVSPHHIAIAYVGLNEKDRALEWLEKAYESHEEILVFLDVDATWDKIRSDTRFQDLMCRLGLPKSGKNFKPNE
jgi:serine/threonine protein kinase/tetratricopeptide (TPR) repeat protein